MMQNQHDGMISRTDVPQAPAVPDVRCDAAAIEKHEEALLDEALALSFPASDPVAVPSYSQALEDAKRNGERTPEEPV
jgi:hypothetical protein